jgi:hypothetical protein
MRLLLIAGVLAVVACGDNRHPLTEAGQPPVDAAGPDPAVCTADNQCASQVCDGSQCMPPDLVVYAAPTGSGSACTQAAPCAIDEAFAIAGAPRNTIKLLSGDYTQTIDLQGNASLYVDGFGAIWHGNLTLQYANVRMAGVSMDGGVGCACTLPFPSCTSPFGSIALEQVSVNGVGFGSCGGSIDRSRINGTVSETVATVAITNSVIVSGNPLSMVSADIEGSFYGRVSISFSTIIAGQVECAPGLLIDDSIVASPTIALQGDMLHAFIPRQPCLARYSLVTPQDDPLPLVNSLADLDPHFVDLASGDYHLSAISPAGHAADPAATQAIDFDGNVRPPGAASMGAFELEVPQQVGPASRIVLRSGNNQSGVTEMPLGAPLVARVQDANGIPVAGYTVAFVVTAGGGTVSTPSATTDARGQAQTAWTLGAPGTNTVEARASGLTGSPIVFTANAAASPAKDITSFVFKQADNPGVLTADVPAVVMPNWITATVLVGTDVTALVASFQTTGQSVAVGGTLQTSGVTPNNFTSDVTYTVTAADLSTQNYLVTVYLEGPACVESTAQLADGGREQHTSDTLLDGRVLVTGGDTVMGGVVASTELYDPMSMTWSDAGDMSSPREGHSSVLLANGAVLVAGGYDGISGQPFATAEVFSPSTGKWSAAAPMNSPRMDFTLSRLADGRVLAVGGYDAPGVYADSAEIYDPIADTWTTTGSMSTPRARHVASVLEDGRVLVAAGYDGLDLLASSEIYDPTLGSWSSTGAISVAVQYPLVARLASGKVLLAGGFAPGPTAAATLYDPSTGTWSDAGPMTTRRESATATLLPSGQVLVVGGYDGVRIGPLATTETYDPATNSWSLDCTMTTARQQHGASLLASGQILISGGYTGDASILADTSEAITP